VKIRHKLTLYFSLASTLIILGFGISVYFFSAQYRKNEFFQRLKARVEIAEKFFLERSNFSEEEAAKIRDQFLNTLPSETEEVATISTDWRHRLKHEYPTDFLEELELHDEVYFYNDTVQGVGRIFHLKDGNYAVMITAVDKIGMRVLGNLRVIITLTILVAIMVITTLSYYLSNRLIWPISRKIRRANTISGTNLHERLIVYNPDDELGEMAIAFNKLLDRLEGAFKMQKLFVANASHEIRNPLTAILGETEVALARDRSVEEYRESLKSISMEADRLNLLINNLFQLSSVSDNVVSIKREPILLTELINDARKKHDFLNPNNQLLVHFDEFAKNEVVIVFGNRILLQTALINIMDNASKFSSDDVVIMDVTVKNESVTITVVDKGVGIPENDIAKITQPFFRAENVRQIRGTGIGIPLTLRIVEIHGGKLDVQSELNKGTTVTITLPLAAAVGSKSINYPSKKSFASVLITF
jgi:signal transduction histidine kinase